MGCTGVYSALVGPGLGKEEAMCVPQSVVHLELFYVLRQTRKLPGSFCLYPNTKPSFIPGRVLIHQIEVWEVQKGILESQRGWFCGDAHPRGTLKGTGVAETPKPTKKPYELIHSRVPHWGPYLPHLYVSLLETRNGDVRKSIHIQMEREGVSTGPSPGLSQWPQVQAQPP